jgi:hypothetical protein
MRGFQDRESMSRRAQGPHAPPAVDRRTDCQPTPLLGGRRRLASVYSFDYTGLEDPTTFAGGVSSCAGEIPAYQSIVSMASGDLKGKMNYRDWPVPATAMPKATYRAMRSSAGNR